MSNSSAGPPPDDPIEMNPVGDPLLRQPDLTENSTFYDYLLANPSQEGQQLMWLLWTIMFFVIAFCATAVFLPVAFTRNIRKKSFNFYLVFLMIPDVAATWVCFVNCLLNYVAEEYVGGAWMCYFQSFYLISWVSVNAWLNAAVTRQVLTMLKGSKYFVKYQPPTQKRVVQESLACYFWSFFVASWGIYGAAASWWPHQTVLRLACVPSPVNDASMLFFYLVFFPSLIGIPFGYVVYAAWVIWRQELLPPPGRRRTLSTYFFRLAFVFIIMWIPGIVFMFVTPAWTNSWVEWFGGFWGHMQVAVSAFVTLMKPDIWKAFKDFYTCKHLRDESYGYDMDASNHSMFSTAVSSVQISSIFTKRKKGSTLKDEIRMLEEDHARWRNEEKPTESDPAIPMSINLSSAAPVDEEMGMSSNMDSGTLEVGCVDLSIDNSGKDLIEDDSGMDIDIDSNDIDPYSDECDGSGLQPINKAGINVISEEPITRNS